MWRCLIIDDSPLVRKVARHVFEKMRFSTDEAATAQDGLNLCRAKMPAAILLDWHLPGMSSMEFLAALRGFSSASRPYIVYCTTDNDPEDNARALSAGCNATLVKPFTVAELEAKFANIRMVA